MAKGVLGNDPFQRGAAPRSPQQELPLSPTPTVVSEQGKGPSKAPRRPVSRHLGRTGLGGTALRGWKAMPGQKPSASGTPAPPELIASNRLEELPQMAVEGLRAPLTSARDAAESVVEAMKGVFRAARAALGASSSIGLDRFGQDADLIQQLSPIANFFYDRYWRVSVEGAEDIPEGPVILVANHSGALPLDGPILRMAIRRRRPELCEARWLLEDAIFYLPALGLLLNRIGAVRASAENALQLLDERRPVIVFPEGIQGISKTFSDRYQLRPFGRGGFVKIALRTRAPILPVAIFGAEESMPVLAKIPGGALGLPDLPLALPPLPTKWSIRFGAPIQVPAEIAETNAAELQRWTENTRESIQQMLRSMMAKRRSVFSG